MSHRSGRVGGNEPWSADGLWLMVRGGGSDAALGLPGRVNAQCSMFDRTFIIENPPWVRNARHVSRERP
ncbi:hypothetical protein NSPZN2_50210 [Nitrospira defluvii]|uniref:Uncharacterized protein n=1 Tax=Nitrospira defluvii TaxID=330214 RepID=A0ABM8S487_9BACT|nr:hypothetical protein NSPZN2_50210 [Nitrospira defluvii]